jgi:hypothetical protein
MDTVPLTGAEVREWRLGWGLQIRELAPRLSYTPGGITQIELGYRRVPARVAEYIRTHPAPAAVATYPPTPAGFAAALAALGMGRGRFATWWGGISPMGVWHWLHGHAALPAAVAAWLRAGAPRTGRLTPPAPADHAEPPGLPPAQHRKRPGPDPRRRPGPDWVWLADPQGWSPPAGLCRPGETYGELRWCSACAFRVDCAELSRQERTG